jgi:hypothetical protein
VATTPRLPKQFSVLCANCGRRKEYQLGEIYDAKPDPETIHAFRRGQFGKMKVPMQAKSARSAWLSWLLQ